MPPKRKESELKTWEEVDNAMKELGELQIKKEKLEGEQTLKINQIKDETLQKAAGLDERISKLKKEIERFAEEHRADFSQKRSKNLNFGKIFFRYTESISAKCIATAISALKALNLDSFIRVKEELDKDQLKTLDAKTLARCGITLKQVDKITIEPDYVKLAAANSTNSAG